jgi:hypothetical protein
MRLNRRIAATVAGLAALVALSGIGGATAATYWINGDRISPHSLRLRALTPSALAYLHHPGATGPAGAGLFGTVPPGRTLEGVFVVQQGYQTLGTGVTVVSFQQPFAHGLKAQWVPPGTTTQFCPGTPAAPTAAPGHFCAYLVQVTGLTNNISDPAASVPPSFTTGTLGASLIGTVDQGSGSPQVALSGSWAATAP